ncbi:hypothetical protein glysoja_012951 [Glycine soja]|nr:hypothetical protein glysoja_012951 [Glycine soja]
MFRESLLFARSGIHRHSPFSTQGHLQRPSLKRRCSFLRPMARPGERWSETLMRRCDETELVVKIRGGAAEDGRAVEGLGW